MSDLQDTLNSFQNALKKSSKELESSIRSKLESVLGVKALVVPEHERVYEEPPVTEEPSKKNKNNKKTKKQEYDDEDDDDYVDDNQYDALEDKMLQQKKNEDLAKKN